MGKTMNDLKDQAKRHDRSLQGEVKRILEENASRPNETPLAIAERWQGYFAGRTFSDSAELIRQDRDHR